MRRSSTLVPTLIYLVRNGQPHHRVDGSGGARFDPELDEPGRRQARCLAQIFRQRGLTRVLCAPSRRTQQTAAYIAEASGLAVEVNDSLSDRDYGPWSKLPRNRVDALFGSIDHAPDIERYHSFSQRVTEAMARIAYSSYSGEVIVMVNHKSVNRALMTHFFSSQFKCFDDVPQSYGCWSLVEHTPLRRWKLLAVDISVPHAQQAGLDGMRRQA